MWRKKGSVYVWKTSPVHRSRGKVCYLCLVILLSCLVGCLFTLAARVCCTAPSVRIEVSPGKWSMQSAMISAYQYMDAARERFYPLSAPTQEPPPGHVEKQFAREVRQRCNVRGPPNVEQPQKWQMDMLFSHMLYDDRHQIAFCYAAKVGCSNWKRVFAVLKSGNASDYKLPHSELHFRRKGHVNYLSDLTYSEALVRLQTYRKVMFVRDPATRLLGVYRDLLAWRPETASNAFMQRHFFEYRLSPRVGRALKPNDVNVSLTSYFNLVLSANNVVAMDEHWQSYMANCMPCMVKYDYIGRHEELSTSADNVLSALGVGDVVQFPKKELDYNLTPYRRNKARDTYRKVSKEQLKRVWKQYEDDLELFDYKVDSKFGSEPGSEEIEPDTLGDYIQNLAEQQQKQRKQPSKNHLL